MNGFVPNVGNDSNDTTDIVISNDGWYPNIQSKDFRETMRVGKSIVNQQLAFAVEQAIPKVNKDLLAYRATRIIFAEKSIRYGAKTLDEILYITAVYNLSKSILTNQYRDYDSTKTGHEEADLAEGKIDTYQFQALSAISQLLGKPRLTCELL